MTDDDLNAIRDRELEEMRAEDARQAALGLIPVCCSWCGGEFHAYPAADDGDLDINGGYSCSGCVHKNGY